MRHLTDTRPLPVMALEEYEWKWANAGDKDESVGGEEKRVYEAGEAIWVRASVVHAAYVKMARAENEKAPVLGFGGKGRWWPIVSSWCSLFRWKRVRNVIWMRALTDRVPGQENKTDYQGEQATFDEEEPLQPHLEECAASAHVSDE